MTTEQIEARLSALERWHARERDPRTLAKLADLISQLLDLEPDDEPDNRASTGPG